MIASRFHSEESMYNFFDGIEEEFLSEDLEKIISVLNNGFGKIDSQLVIQYGLNIY